MLRGYRSMWNKLRTTYNIIVPRDSVMEILRELDPLRSNERRSRKLEAIRVSYTWMYRWLLPKIIWLKVCRTNNHPKIPARFYIQTVQHFKYCPSKVQTDCVTENGILAKLQCTLVGSTDAHRYGSSPSNQRIENWWSHNKRLYMTWVIDHFKSLVDEGKYHLSNYFLRNMHGMSNPSFYNKS